MGDLGLLASSLEISCGVYNSCQLFMQLNTLWLYW